MIINLTKDLPKEFQIKKMIVVKFVAPDPVIKNNTSNIQTTTITSVTTSPTTSMDSQNF